MKRLRIQVSPPQPERKSPEPGFSRPGTGHRLPEGVREKMEGLLGADFSNVRVQVGPQAPSLGALAFTRGSHIHFAPGQYDPATTMGQRLLAHELTHVVQQREDRAKAPRGSGPAVVQDPGLEAEAERMGSRAAARPGSSPGRLAPVQAPARLQAPDAGAARPIQMAINLGWVPAKPNNWRQKTQVKGFDQNTKGFGRYGTRKRSKVQTDNLNYGAGAAPVLPALAGGYPVSDHSGKALLTMKQSTPIAPEVDHMVEVAEGGSNDYENARLISKSENNSPKTLRPKTPAAGGPIADTELRLYTPINIQVKNGPPDYGLAAATLLKSGHTLKLKEVKALYRWASAGGMPNTWAAFDSHMLNAIQRKNRGGGWRRAGKNGAGKTLLIKVW